MQTALPGLKGPEADYPRGARVCANGRVCDLEDVLILRSQ